MDLHCDNCGETAGEDSVLIEQGYARCPGCGSVLGRVKKEKKFSRMNLFELAAWSSMPSHVYKEIMDRMGLALTYLEDGAVPTAAAILRKFLNH
jgi:DNA-directed RNA polymerase subunit RPC12/RpoP